MKGSLWDVGRQFGFRLRYRGSWKRLNPLSAFEGHDGYFNYYSQLYGVYY